MTDLASKTPAKATAIANAIRDQIARGDLEAGDALPTVTALGEQFEVSHPTMRAALRILESEGLLKVHRGVNGGPRVQELDVDVLTRQAGLYLQLNGSDLRDLVEALRLIQPGAVGLAAQRCGPEQLDALRAAAEAVGRCQTMAEFSDASADFVVLLLEASGNQAIKLFARIIETLIRREVHRELDDRPVDGSVAWIATRFTEIVELLALGESEAAEALWRAFIIMVHPDQARTRRNDTR